jgi:hypothetical protein
VLQRKIVQRLLFRNLRRKRSHTAPVPVPKPEEKKVVPPKTPNATGGKRPLIPSNDDISDDPIAQSL